MLKKLSVITMVLSSLLLTACYDDVGVTMYEAGVYKGATDPMVSKSKGAEHKERLRKRFNMVQTDR